MSDIFSGRISNVVEERLGTELAEDADSGATAITVADVLSLDGDGGEILIGSSTYYSPIEGGPLAPPITEEIAKYTVDDAEAGTLTLTTPLVNDHSAEESVWMEPATYERVAWVQGHGQEEALPARIPHSLWDRIPLGIRPVDTAEGEEVETSPVGSGLVVTDVLGQPPAIDGNYLVPDSIPRIVLHDGDNSVYVKDYKALTYNDDDAIEQAIAVATDRGGTRIIFGGEHEYEINALHIFEGGNVPVGLGSTISKIKAIGPDAGLRVGPPLGYAPEVASSWGGFTFDGDGVAEQGIITNTITSDCEDVVSVNIAVGNAFFVYGQNNNYYNVNAGGCYDGTALELDNGAGQNRFWGCRFTDCSAWLVHIGQSVDSWTYAYAIPQANAWYDCIIEQQDLAWGDGWGAILQTAGANNVFDTADIFHPRGSSIIHAAANPVSGRSGDVSGRLYFTGVTKVIGGGAGYGQFAFEANAYSGGVAGALPVDQVFLWSGDVIVSGCEGGTMRSGSSTNSTSISANWTIYGSGPFWTAHGTDAASPGGVFQNGSALGFGRLPGGTVSVEAWGSLTACVGLDSQMFVGDDGGYPVIAWGPTYNPVLYSLGEALLATDAKLTVHGLSAAGNRITDVDDGVDPGDAVNKSQLDALTFDALVYKGAIDCSGNPNYPAADAGHVYKVSVAGKIGGASGPKVEVQDTLICTADSTASGTHASVGEYWNIVQGNLDGAVIGPSSATDTGIPVFDGTTGKLIKSSGVQITSGDELEFSGDTNLYRDAADTLKTDDKFIAAQGLDAGSNQIENVADPVADDDAATKAWVLETLESFGAPTYIGTALGSGSSVTLPATQADDIIIIVSGSGFYGSAPTFGGTYSGGAKTSIATADNGRARIDAHWSRATGNHSGETITLTVGTPAVAIYRGCPTGSSPIDTNTSTDAPADGSATVAPASFATTVDHVVCVLAATAFDGSWSAETMNSNAMHERQDGGSNSILIADKAKGLTGSTGAFSATRSATDWGQAAVAFALKPA